MAHRQRGDACLEAAGGAKQVAGHRLRGRDRQLRRMLPEQASDRQRLQLVVVRGRGAMGVDVVHRLDADAGVFEGRCHDTHAAVPIL